MGKWLRAASIAVAVLFAVYLAPAQSQAATAYTVTGTVTANNQNVDQAWLKVVNVNDPKAVFDVRLSQGTFSVTLENGNYKLDSYWVDSIDQPVVLDYPFTVNNSDLTLPAVSASADNVSGSVKDASNNAVTSVFLYIQPSGAKENGIRAKVSSGAFSLYLADGTYQVEGYWDPASEKFVDLRASANSSFTVANGTSAPASINLQVPANNVTGTLEQQTGTNTTTPIDKVYLNLHNQANQWFNIEVANGTFSTHLVDDTYYIDGYWDQTNNEFVPFGNNQYTITVSNGTVVQGSTTVIVVPFKNVSGTLLAADQTTEIHDVWLHMHEVTGQNQWYNVHVNNGAFSLSLPNGEYTIDGYWDHTAQTEISLKADFSVAGGVLVNGTNVVNGSLTLVAKSSNVTGTLQIPNGEQVTHGNLNLHLINNPNGWYNAPINNNNFSLYLPDGDYQVEGFWSQDTQEYTPITTMDPIKVSSNGAVVTPNPIVIQVPSKNVTGTLKKSDDSPVDNVWLHMHQVDGTDFRGYSVQVKNGNFSLSLPKGNYQIDGYWDTVKDNSLQYKFTVADVNVTTSLNIVIQAPNVNGTLKTSNGTSIQKANLNIRSMNANPAKEDWFNVQVDNGEFATYLPDGQYTFNGYWDHNLQEYVQLSNQSFSVSQGVVSAGSVHIVIPDKNVFGKITNPDGVGYDKGWLNLYQTDSTQQNFGYSVHVTNGDFSLSLPNGKYRVNGFYHESTNTQISLNYTFEVVNNVSNPNPLAISVHVNNVTGTLKVDNGTQNPTLVTDADINIHDTSNRPDGFYNTSVHNGTFGLYLPDGTYQVDGYWDRTQQKYVQIQNKTFTVSNNAVVDILIPKSNVKGTIKNSDGTQNVNGWLQLQSNNGMNTSFYNTQVVNGIFELYLPDGSYQITGLSKNDGSFISLMHEFAVSGSAIVDYTIQPNNVKGTLKREDKMPIDQVNLNFYQPIPNGKNFNVRVNNGVFELYMPDGDYQVSGFWDPVSQDYVRLEYSFTVPTQQTIDIIVPHNNVTGTVKNSDGSVSIVKGNLQLQNTDPNSDKGYGVQVVDGKFGIHLSEGNYRITGLEKADGSYIAMGVNFTVGTTGDIVVDVTDHPTNVAGTLITSSGAGVDGVFLSIEKSQSTYYNVRVQNGQFNIYLPDGDYKTNGYWNPTTGSYVQLGLPFTVKGQTLVDLVVPRDNVIGTVKDSTGSLIAKGSLELHGMDPNVFFSASVMITNGKFALHLPDGNYRISSFKKADGTLVTLLVDFTVTTNADAVVDVVVHPSNVTGTLKNAGTALDGVTLYINEQLTNKYYNVGVKAGSFDLYLPNGNYQVTGYWDPATQTSVQWNVTFQVANGSGTVNIDIPKNNVSGKVSFSDPNQPVIAKGKLQLRNLDQNDKTVYTTPIANGNYSMYLPTGNYRITGLVLSDGTIISLLVDFAVVSNADSVVNVVVQPSNVAGTLKKGTTAVDGVTLSVDQKNVTNKHYDVQVKAGSFNLYLPDGDYQVNGYWDQTLQMFVQLNVSFQVINGSGKVDIVISQSNVSGTITNSVDTLPAPTKGILQLQSLGLVINKSYSAPVVYGKFDLYLPAGQYRINELNLDNGTLEGLHIALLQDFTVGSNLITVDVPIHPSNVIGTVKWSNLTAVTNSSLNIQLSGQTNQRYMVRVIDGNFDLYLPDGTYMIYGISINDLGRFLTLQTQIIVQGGVPTTASTDGKVNIVIPPQINGTLTLNVGTTVTNLTNVEIHMQEVGTTLTYWGEVVNGVFSVYLPDGSYHVGGYYDRTLQKNVPVNYDFVVAGGVVKDLNSAVLGGINIVTHPSNVIGTFQDANGTPYTGVKLQISLSGGGGSLDVQVVNGAFDVYLPDGNYTITGFYTPGTPQFTSLNQTFSVTNGVTTPSSIAVVY